MRGKNGAGAGGGGNSGGHRCGGAVRGRLRSSGLRLRRRRTSGARENPHRGGPAAHGAVCAKLRCWLNVSNKCNKSSHNKANNNRN